MFVLLVVVSPVFIFANFSVQLFLVVNLRFVVVLSMQYNILFNIVCEFRKLKYTHSYVCMCVHRN